ncbi:Hypothetical protein CINCED_3A019527 [Cinara cedri]|uniref:Uncharacterized protein n=1 Tax=Cinara cedri TaxID=506608 RepID=A0A5E4MI82_9HEMI|nr:Hypothetical protein CINCED_3A019527 [Cinara cedri]
MSLIIEAVISFVTHLFVGVSFSAILFMMWRDDVAARLIKKNLGFNQKISEFDQNWTDVFKELAVDGVPPAVWVQAMVNRLQAFESISLAPLNKCLEMTSTRLADTRKMMRWAVVRQKHERSLLLLGITPRVSTSTNTDNVVEPLAETTILVDSLSMANSGSNAKSSSNLTARAVSGMSAGVMSDMTSGAVSDLTAGVVSDLTAGAVSDLTAGAVSDLTAGVVSDLTPRAVSDLTAGTVSDLTARAVSNLTAGAVSDMIGGALSHMTMEKPSDSYITTTRSISNRTTMESISAMTLSKSSSNRTTSKSISAAIVDPASRVRADTAGIPSFGISVELVAKAVVDKILWMRNTLPVYWNRVVRISKAFNSALHSEQLRNILEYSLRQAKRLVKLSTDINLVKDLTKVSLQFAPDVVEEPVKTKRFNFY